MKYEIWQLKHENLRAYGFEDYEWAKEHGFKIEDYEKIYESETLLAENELKLKIENYVESIRLPCMSTNKDV